MDPLWKRFPFYRESLNYFGVHRGSNFSGYASLARKRVEMRGSRDITLGKLMEDAGNVNGASVKGNTDSLVNFSGAVISR